MTIDELKTLQAQRALGDVHLVHLGESGFTIAHTDTERASGTPLWKCPLHGWLQGLDGPPTEVGIYVAVPHVPDAYSEPLDVYPWDFDPLVRR